MLSTRETLRRDAGVWVLTAGCARLDTVPVSPNPYTMPYERWPLLVCHGIRADLARGWPRFKFYY